MPNLLDQISGTPSESAPPLTTLQKHPFLSQLLGGVAGSVLASPAGPIASAAGAVAGAKLAGKFSEKTPQQEAEEQQQEETRISRLTPSQARTVRLAQKGKQALAAPFTLLGQLAETGSRVAGAGIEAAAKKYPSASEAIGVTGGLLGVLTDETTDIALASIPIHTVLKKTLRPLMRTAVAKSIVDHPKVAEVLSAGPKGEYTPRPSLNPHQVDEIIAEIIGAPGERQKIIARAIQQLQPGIAERLALPSPEQAGTHAIPVGYDVESSPRLQATAPEVLAQGRRAIAGRRVKAVPQTPALARPIAVEPTPPATPSPAPAPATTPTVEPEPPSPQELQRRAFRGSSLKEHVKGVAATIKPTAAAFTAKTPETYHSVSGHYAIVEGDQLKYTGSGRENPAYQPRSPNAAGLQMVATEVATKTQPDLLGASALTTEGAPLVTPAGDVMSGNARTAGLVAGYQGNNPSVAQGYRQWLEAHANEYGSSPEQVKAMQRPVLIRVVTDADQGITTGDFLSESNLRTTRAPARPEQARMDADAFDKVAKLYDPQKGFDANFQRSLVDAYPKSERPSLLNEDGTPNLRSIKLRAAPAMLASWLGTEHTDLLNWALEDAEKTGTQGTANVLMSMANEMRPLKGTSLDPAPVILKALNDFRRMKQMGETPDRYYAQSDLTQAPSPMQVEMASAFHGETQANLRTLLSAYANRAAKVDQTTAEMFPNQESTSEAIWNLAKEDLKNTKAAAIIAKNGKNGQMVMNGVYRKALLEDQGPEAKSLGAAALNDPESFESPEVKKAAYDLAEEVRKIKIATAVRDNPWAKTALWQQIMDIPQNVKRLRFGVLQAINYARPYFAVMKEIGFKPLHDLFVTAHVAMFKDRLEYAQRINDIFQKYGIQQGNNMDRAVWLHLDGKADEIGPGLGDASQIEAASKELRTIYDELKNKFDPQGKAGYVSQYVTHLLEGENDPEGLTGVELELMKSIEFEKNSSKATNPFLEKSRVGGFHFKESVSESVNAYLNAGLRKFYLNRPLSEAAALTKNVRVPEEVRNYVKTFVRDQLRPPERIEEQLGGGVKAGARMISRLAKLVGQNKLASSMDQLAKGKDWVAFRRAEGGLRGNMVLGVMGASAGTALRYASQQVFNLTDMPFSYWALGLQDMTAAAAGNADLQALLKESGVLLEARSNQVLEQAPGNIRAKYGEWLMKPMVWADSQNRMTAFFGGFKHGIDQGMSRAEAMEHGVEVAEKAQFRYLTTDTPHIFQTPFGRTFFAIGSFPFRMVEWLSPLSAAKEAATLHWEHEDVKRMVKYILASAAAVQGARSLGVDLRGDFWPIYTDERGKKRLGFARFGLSPAGRLAQDVVAVSSGRPIPHTAVGEAARLIPGGGTVARGVSAYQRAQKAGREPSLAEMLGLIRSVSPEQ